MVVGVFFVFCCLFVFFFVVVTLLWLVLVAWSSLGAGPAEICRSSQELDTEFTLPSRLSSCMVIMMVIIIATLSVALMLAAALAAAFCRSSSDV